MVKKIPQKIQRVVLKKFFMPSLRTPGVNKFHQELEIIVEVSKIVIGLNIVAI